MAPTLYVMGPTSQATSVQITAKALGIQLEERQLDLLKDEHLNPEYLKVNPQHTVPTLVEDDGYILWDSHAISAYLVSKYGKDDSLYPKDLKQRGTIDQRLHFETAAATNVAVKILRPIIRNLKTSIDDSDKECIGTVYGVLEAFLDGKPWMAGNSLTIADYHLYVLTTTSNVAAPIDGQKYPKLAAWLKKVDVLPEVEVSKEALAIFKDLVKSKLT